MTGFSHDFVPRLALGLLSAAVGIPASREKGRSFIFVAKKDFSIKLCSETEAVFHQSAFRFWTWVPVNLGFAFPGGHGQGMNCFLQGCVLQCSVLQLFGPALDQGCSTARGRFWVRGHTWASFLCKTDPPVEL